MIGVQGGLLFHFFEPIYISTVTGKREERIIIKKIKCERKLLKYCCENKKKSLLGKKNNKE